MSRTKIYGVYDEEGELVFVGTEGQMVTFLKHDWNPESLAVKQVRIKNISSEEIVKVG